MRAILLAMVLGFGGGQGGVIQGRHVEVGSKDSGVKITEGGYPTGDFELEYTITYKTPGSVLDTIGINAAPTGSWSTTISPDGHATFNIWDGSRWHNLSTKAAVPAEKATQVRFVRKGQRLECWVNGIPDAQMSIGQPLSGTPVYAGDFKGDEHWGSGYNIHQGFVGTVEIRWFGLPREPVATANAVIDRTGSLSTSELASLISKVEAVAQKEGIALIIAFVKGLDSAARGAEGRALYNPAYEATKKPTVVCIMGDTGTTLYYTASWLEATGKDKVQASINGLTTIKDPTARVQTWLDRLFAAVTTPVHEPIDEVKSVPARRINGKETELPARSPATIAVGDGIKIDVSGLPTEMAVTTAVLPKEDLGTSTLESVGPTVGLQWEGYADPAAFIPRVTFPASATGGKKQLVVWRKGEVFRGDALVPDQLTFLPASFNSDGSLSAIDPFAAPDPGSVLMASIAWPEKPTFTTRYGIASYENALNWKNDPQLVRMVPSKDSNERQPFYKLTEDERKKRDSLPIKNVIVLVHGHNEYEKGGFVLGDSGQPWAVAYKRDVWTLFWKSLKKEAKDYLDTTLVYEFIYPSYRPVFAAEFGVDGLGLSLAKALADEFVVARTADKGLDFNVYFVAHSMGGLVMRSGLNEFENARLRNTSIRADMLAQWTRNAVTWGTPHHGSPLVTMRYLLNGGYDLEGKASVLPVSLLKQSNNYSVALNYFAAIDTPGERALRWDNHRPLNLTTSGWASPRREVIKAGNDETYAAEKGLEKGEWLYSHATADFNRRDRYRDKVIAFYGLTSKTLPPANYVLRFWKNTLASRFYRATDIQRGTFFMEWLYQNPDKVLGTPVFKGDGAVPIESMIGEGVLTRSRSLGDVDHEEYYGAPDGSKFAQEALGLTVSKTTLEELGFNGDKKGRNFPPSVDAQIPFPPTTPIGTQAALAVQAQLVWNGDPKPGLRAKEAQVVALDPAKPSDLGRVVPSRLEIKETGTISGTMLAKDLPAKPLQPAVRVVFRDGTVLDSKISEVKDDILPALQKTTQLTLALTGVYESSSVPGSIGASAAIVQTTYGFAGDMASVLINTAKDYGKTLERPTLTWNGSSFNMNLSTGALERTQTSRAGSTLLKATQALSLTGRYDAASRSIVDLTLSFQSDSMSDFTPDPNWKPRDRLEAEVLGPPKPSKSRTIEKRVYRVDQVAVLGVPGSSDQFPVYVGFRREGAKRQPEVYWQFEQTVETTGVPTTQVKHKVILGPSTKPSVYGGPVLTLTFFRPK